MNPITYSDLKLVLIMVPNPGVINKLKIGIIANYRSIFCNQSAFLNNKIALFEEFGLGFMRL